MEEDYPDMPSIDWQDGSLVESCMKELPEHHRRALKAFYIQYPYTSNHSIAAILRTTIKKFENDLSQAKTRLSKELNNKLSRN
jgi:DNA-directed RNA polymerase specialized sigma24 family protein